MQIDFHWSSLVGRKDKKNAVGQFKKNQTALKIDAVLAAVLDSLQSATDEIDIMKRFICVHNSFKLMMLLADFPGSVRH